jgi:lysophospholipase L1-like esterase
MEGQDSDQIVSSPNAPTEIVVAGVGAQEAPGNVAWTWSDWTPLASIDSEDSSASRVLMLRALIPPGQTVCFAKGLLRSFTRNPILTNNFDFFVGGIKFNHDRVSNPETTVSDTEKLWRDNHLVPGSVFPIVQFLTKRAGIVGIATGDSHHQGTSTTDEFAGFLYRGTTMLGAKHRGRYPHGMVNCGVGGMTSRQFFSRLDALLPAVRPSYAVLPGWTFNDCSGKINADRRAMELFLARLVRAVEACLRNNVLPILLTPFPRDPGNMTETQLEPWHWLRREIFDVAGADCIVIDASTALGRQQNGVLDGTYLPDLSSDGIHPNDAGHSLIAGLLVSALEAMVPRP